MKKDIREEIVELFLSGEGFEEIAEKLTMETCVAEEFKIEPPFTCNEDGSHCYTCWLHKVEEVLLD